MFNDFYHLTQQCFKVFNLLKTSENYVYADIITEKLFQNPSFQLHLLS